MPTYFLAFRSTLCTVWRYHGFTAETRRPIYLKMPHKRLCFQAERSCSTTHIKIIKGYCSCRCNRYGFCSSVSYVWNHKILIVSDKRSFYVLSASEFGAQIYDLGASTAHERHEWLKLVSSAIDIAKAMVCCIVCSWLFYDILADWRDCSWEYS